MTFPRSHDKTAMFQNGRENLREIGNGSLPFLYFSLSLSLALSLSFFFFFFFSLVGGGVSAGPSVICKCCFADKSLMRSMRRLVRQRGRC